MLEEKIRSFRAKIILPAVASICLAYVSSCGQENKEPSQYCCEALKCGEGGNPPICDGDGDNCYCRSKSCCEEKECEKYGQICSPGYEGCECTNPPSDRY